MFRRWRSRWWCGRWLRWLGRLLWPSLAARAFWGTTIRSARDEIEFGLDPEDVIEPCGEQFFATAHLHGVARTIIVEPNGQ